MISEGLDICWKLGARNLRNKFDRPTGWHHLATMIFDERNGLDKGKTFGKLTICKPYRNDFLRDFPLKKLPLTSRISHLRNSRLGFPRPKVSEPRRARPRTEVRIGFSCSVAVVGWEEAWKLVQNSPAKTGSMSGYTYMVPYSYPPSKTHRVEDSDAYWCVKFRCFIHLEAYIAHIQLWPVSLKNTTYTQGFYFIVMLFFVLLHEFQSNGSLPCEGGFSHICTIIFFKEYHKHCLKWVLKGFLSQGILRPLFSRHVLLYSMKFCKKWCYVSTLLSEYRVLHPF